jgi:SHAQKYF class myb-like DNA-binding protein
MRAKSRAEARAKGESDVRDDKYEEYAYSVCAPGTERTGRWTKDEHERFVEGLKRHGKQWKKVAAYVGTRTVTQTKTHAQKYFQKIQKVGPV